MTQEEVEEEAAVPSFGLDASADDERMPVSLDWVVERAKPQTANDALAPLPTSRRNGRQDCR